MLSDCQQTVTDLIHKWLPDTRRKSSAHKLVLPLQELEVVWKKKKEEDRGRPVQTWSPTLHTTAAHAKFMQA